MRFLLQFEQKYEKRAANAARDYVPASAAGIAVVFAAAVQPAAAVVAAGAVMYPDDHDGNDHDDPEGLIIAEKAAVAAGIAVVVTGCVHRSDSLLIRFLTPYYSAAGKV